MVADTLRQKYIYATPYDEDEFPLVELDRNITILSKNVFKINGTQLYSLDEDEFKSMLVTIKSKYDSVLIINDYSFKSSNAILNRGCLCHMMAFAYLFKQNNLKCNII